MSASDWLRKIYSAANGAIESNPYTQGLIGGGAAVYGGGGGGFGTGGAGGYGYTATAAHFFGADTLYVSPQPIRPDASFMKLYDEELERARYMRDVEET